MRQISFVFKNIFFFILSYILGALITFVFFYKPSGSEPNLKYILFCLLYFSIQPGILLYLYVSNKNKAYLNACIVLTIILMAQLIPLIVQYIIHKPDVNPYIYHQ